MLSSMFWRFSRGLSYSVNFYLVTLLACAFCLVEPLLQRIIQQIDDRAEHSPAFARATTYLIRPTAYACLLLLFLIFDDRDTQFIYFQF